MDYDDPMVRRAYLAGASEAVESAVLTLPAPKVRELEHWLTELRAWHGGDPPPAPWRWEED